MTNTYSQVALVDEINAAQEFSLLFQIAEILCPAEIDNPAKKKKPDD